MPTDGKMIKHQLQKKLIDDINEKEILSLLESLIRIPSHPKYPGQENEIGHFISNLLHKSGIDYVMQEVKSGRKNIIATLHGIKNRPSLAFNGHLDTVPPSSPKAAIKIVKKNNRIYGLGSADMKGSIAAMLYVMMLLKRHRIRLDSNLFFTGVVGEESGGIGTAALLKSGFYADYFIIGEPTDLNIVHSHKGVYNIDIHIEGKAAHASIPEKGASAIEAMAEFIALLKKDYLPLLKSRFQPKVGSPTVNFGVIRGGQKVNIVAEKCFLKIDRRYIESENITDLIPEVEHYLKQICNSHKGLSYTIKSGLPKSSYFGPFYLSENHVLVKKSLHALKSVGLEPQVCGMQGWTDGAAILNQGYPSLIVGPAKIEVAHSIHEHVEIESLIKAAKAYMALVFEICIHKQATAL